MPEAPACQAASVPLYLPKWRLEHFRSGVRILSQMVCVIVRLVLFILGLLYTSERPSHTVIMKW